MVDVLLVLMLFFMSITSTELLKKEKNLQLAEANSAKLNDQKRKTNEVVINVGWNNTNNTARFSMDGVDYPAANTLQDTLTGRVRENPTTYVLIRADKDVEYSNISDLMSTCASAGIASVTFAVIINSGEAAKAPDSSSAQN